MQVFSSRENIGTLTGTSNTTLQLTASVITVGAQQYTTGVLALDIDVSGFGGLDSTKAANTVYYVYAVVSSEAVGLIGSTSSVAPTGFSNSKRVGAFYTDGSTFVSTVLSLSDIGNREIRKFQEKILTGDITATGDVSDLTFNNLEIGKWYSLNANFSMSDNITSAVITRIRSGASDTGNIYGKIQFQLGGSTQGTSTQGVAFLFQAVSSSLYFYADAPNNINGNGTKDQTFVQLIEVSDVLPTADFT